MAIDCTTALELLLEAEPADLDGSASSELSVHVRECARCRAVGQELLVQQDRLSRELAALRPAVGVEDALQKARRERMRRSRRRQAWRLAAPLAAAAAVAAVFLARGPEAGRMPGEVVALPASRIEPSVEVSAGQNVMVFETRDRSAKVIWFY
ncbi:MAG: hypothetical protein JSU87_11070 [Gemmatimonadota bacterium]|nr:MAG: hypothetical protein JSU87_11070 [Gemmatimonadota bacterium]